MIKIKVAFLEGRLFSSQSGLFENISDFSDLLNKSHFSFEHVNRLIETEHSLPYRKIILA